MLFKFGTSETRLKQDGACILTLFRTIWNFRQHFKKNKVSKACILTRFETITKSEN